MPEQKKDTFKKSFKIKLLIGIATVLLITLMFPKGESIESEVTEGSIWIHDDLIAPFSFPILKDPEVYKLELKNAAENVYPIFIRDAAFSPLDSINNYNEFLLNTIDSAIINELSLNPTFLSSESYNILKTLRSRERNLLTNGETRLEQIFSSAKKVLSNVYENGVVNFSEGMSSDDSIALRNRNIDSIEPLRKFLTESEARTIARDQIEDLSYSQEIKNALKEYVNHFITPNLIYSEGQTKEEVKHAHDNVSRYLGIVNENERIIAKHDRITREAKLKIDSYKEAKGEKIGEEGMIMQGVGKFLHISFLITLLTIYIYLFRKKIYGNNSKIIIIAILFLLVTFITFLINQIEISAPLYLLIFVPAASMLITILFDSRVGFYSTIILALIVGALRGNDYTFAAMNIFAGALSVYTVRDIKNRSQIFRSFLFILLGYTIGLLAFGLERFATAERLLVEFSFAAANAFISPILTYGILIFFERSFKITTDLTLLELSNFDMPLLKEIARKAPGTFNHSMTMGTLAETAAEKINANPLLARVGAYYHDIGKTTMPQNFVENQLNNKNIHEDLSPEESVAIIKRHVEEGIEMGKKYNLPLEIIDFIPAHHGTMVMTFFYDKAKKLYGEEKVNIADYKYPGPKPHTKETAIIMLADGCESAVRSIENPEPSKVENVISNIIQGRISDGQLDDSPITFRDISKIKEAFVSILIGQHHRRIRYPKQDEIEKGEGKKETDEKKSE